jgi:hypothetical protein
VPDLAVFAQWIVKKKEATAAKLAQLRHAVGSAMASVRYMISLH